MVQEKIKVIKKLDNRTLEGYVFPFCP